jgi:4-hydroxybenzoate polyprenyltransferase
MSSLSACAGMIAAYNGIPDSASLVGVGFMFWIIHNTAHPVNDYFDREIDKLARPDAPIPSGEITAEEAKKSMMLHYIVTPALIILISVVVSAETIPLMTTAFFGLLLGAIYSTPPIRLRKRGILKDIAIGLVLPIPFLGGWVAVQAWSIGIEPLVLSSVAFFLSAGAQLLSDIHDMKGEKVVGWKTVPVRIGTKNTFNLSFAMGIITVMLIPIPIFMEWFNRIYTVLAVFIILWILFVYIRAFINFDPEKGRVLNQNLLIGVTLYVVAVIIGSV